ncbi:MAG: radical SAM protein [Candidatus Omnitrophota bacterium]|nr:radical SAM protein [Candidatus Omnitrophota bacterium]
MNVTFVFMGAEGLGLESLSAVLKQHGHRACLAFDPALFDDKLYFYIPQLAKLFDYRKHLLKKIIASKPDIVGFSVFADNFKWACSVARDVKKQLGVPIIFGGIYPTSMPEITINQDCVDMVCLGEGEYPMLELVDCMSKGNMDYSIQNIWFKKVGTVIKNPLRPMQNLDDLPLYDKSLFENEIPIKNCYMTVTAKGCPYHCTYCSQNFLKRLYKTKGVYLTKKSVDNVINELKIMKERYNFKEVDIKDNTFSSDKAWTLEFCRKYKKEIGRIPFRIMTNPINVDDEIAFVLKDAGCFRVQFGVQTMDEKIRKNVLHRPGTNEQIIKGFKNCDKADLVYSIDHIFGLPYETEEQQILAARIYAQCKNVVRITCFWLEFFPQTDIIQIAKETGMITDKDIKNIESGGETCYLFGGSVRNIKLRNMFKSYNILFRAIPILPRPVTNFILNHNFQKSFRFLPRTLTLLFIDFIVSFIKNDLSAFDYMKYYLYQIKKMMFGSNDEFCHDSQLDRYNDLYSKNSSFRLNWEGRIALDYKLPKYVDVFRKLIGEDLRKNVSILELGAGDGQISRLILDDKDAIIKRYVATDISIQGLSRVKDKAIETRLVDSTKLEFPDNSFDVVCCFDVMHHVSRPKKMAEEMLRVSKKHIFLIEANALSLPRRLLEKTTKYCSVDEKSYYPWKYKSFFKNKFVKDVYIKPFLFIVPKVPSQLIRPFAYISEIMERLPIFRWQCSGVAIHAIKK